MNKLKDFKNKSVYISSSMTGLPDFGNAKFYEMESKLRKHGFSSINNPAKIGEMYGYDKDYTFYLKQALKMMLNSDIIYVFGDHEKSFGVHLETELAHTLKIPVFYEEYDELD